MFLRARQSGSIGSVIIITPKITFVTSDDKCFNHTAKVPYNIIFKEKGIGALKRIPLSKWL